MASFVIYQDSCLAIPEAGSADLKPFCNSSHVLKWLAGVEEIERVGEGALVEKNTDFQTSGSPWGCSKSSSASLCEGVMTFSPLHLKLSTFFLSDLGILTKSRGKALLGHLLLKK
jgi:hypothetical protein